MGYSRRKLTLKPHDDGLLVTLFVLLFGITAFIAGVVGMLALSTAISTTFVWAINIAIFKLGIVHTMLPLKKDVLIAVGISAVRALLGSGGKS